MCLVLASALPALWRYRQYGGLPNEDPASVQDFSEGESEGKLNGGNKRS